MRGRPTGRPRFCFILARVLALADVYDALTSDRPYRPAFPPDDALTIMHGEVARKLDPELFRLLRTIVAGGAARAGAARRDVVPAQRALGAEATRPTPT